MATATAKAGKSYRLRPRSSPRLSLVVLSQGDLAQLHRALRVLSPLAAESLVQVIVVRAGWAPNDHLSSLGVTGLVRVPAGASRAEMADRAMAQASGDIILLRHDHAITDLSWAGHLLPELMQPEPAPAERVIPPRIHRHADQVDHEAPDDYPATVLPPSQQHPAEGYSRTTAASGE